MDYNILLCFTGSARTVSKMSKSMTLELKYEYYAVHLTAMKKSSDIHAMLKQYYFAELLSCGVLLSESISYCTFEMDL